MKILVFAKPGAKRAKVEKMENLIPGYNACFSVSVKAPAENGRANEAVLAALAEYVHVPTTSLRLVAGHTARRKVVVLG